MLQYKEMETYTVLCDYRRNGKVGTKNDINVNYVYMDSKV